jgi:hypothetical protein
VEQRVGAVYVREKLSWQPSPAAHDNRTTKVIVGGRAAGNAAAETLRHEGYASRITMLSAFKVGDHVSWNSEAGHVSGTSSRCIRRTLPTRDTPTTRVTVRDKQGAVKGIWNYVGLNLYFDFGVREHDMGRS